ncbi:hypothetical protein FF011L_49020 [Roseimaritima multifibrata]|uniref:Uncharacterized protein n=1 Tax=Roseimaritima multifibrata TaxID=1930274 RepID=A0A517MMI2_9BACT|nr:hypothetical protein FF011L_49020 [Roseimaritima multifibrata]
MYADDQIDGQTKMRRDSQHETTKSDTAPAAGQ